MKSKSITQNNIFRFALATAGILMIPLLFRWDWDLGDFIIMGVLIFGTSLIYELVTKVFGKRNRIAIGVILLILLLLIWAELGVGIFGTPFAGD